MTAPQQRWGKGRVDETLVAQRVRQVCLSVKKPVDVSERRPMCGSADPSAKTVGQSNPRSFNSS